MSERAEELITMYNKEESRAANFRTLYQNTSDLMFPRESQIMTIRTPGEEFTLSDPTGVMASIEMASGLFINWFPPGQRFYNIIMSDRRLNEIESVKRTLGQITEISHEKRASSNFVLQANETLRSLVVFGTGNMFSEWIPGTGLTYKDYDIGQYLIMQNSKGLVDTMLIKYPLTARQAVQEFGEDNVGKSVTEAVNEGKKKNEKFWFIRIIRPREKRNPRLTDNQNMPFESINIDVKDKMIIKGINSKGTDNEGGFREFPHQVPRWSQSSSEVWGRGPGTFALPAVRGFQQIKRDLLESGGKWNDPPLEVDSNFDGEVKTFKGAINWGEPGSIKAIDQGVRGSFPITKDVLEMERQEVKEIFLNDIFVQLRDLKGDRRTQLEIRERLIEGLQRLGLSYGKITQEWLNPLVTRDIMLLQRNGQLPDLPPEMQGAQFKIEYVGRLAMELKSQESRGYRQWVGMAMDIDPVFPAIDNINMDGGFRRVGETLGVSIEDIATLEQVEAKRADRQAKEDAKMAMAAAQVASQAYSQTTGAPEEGSPAEALAGV